ncbi:MAG: hypothetical protein ACR2LG_11475 [Actinomycetota bacterium]
MRTVEQFGIRLAALLLTLVTGLAMFLLAAPGGIVGVVHDAMKSHA